jgi:hypothetical protein
MIYVCDKCGASHYGAAVPEGDEWTCAHCAGHAAWEYADDKAPAAQEHSAHIAAGRKLFTGGQA